MGKTFKDRKVPGRTKFPRVPLIEKRSEPHEDRKHRPAKHNKQWQEEWDEEAKAAADGEPSTEELRNWDDWRYSQDDDWES
jgi:hypothetical protein